MGFDAAGFRREIARLRRETRAALPGAVDRASRLLAAEVRRNAPKETGALAASVAVGKPQARGPSVSQSVTAGGGLDRPEAAQAEYGTHDEAPRPFFRPAIARREPEMIRIIEGVFPDD